mmetsp:Transcript_16327/g.14009  ORF Transcript_16327/g.14009 Transcript_16327/m.14009 type:complete len:81 (+) Transcript_16327:5819-6061(+)
MDPERFNLYASHKADMNKKFKATTYEKENPYDYYEEAKPVTRVYTALSWALKNNWSEILKTALKYNCDASLTYNDGYEKF